MKFFENLVRFFSTTGNKIEVNLNDNITTIKINGKTIDPQSVEGKKILQDSKQQFNDAFTKMDETFEKMDKFFNNL